MSQSPALPISTADELQHTAAVYGPKVTSILYRACREILVVCRGRIQATTRGNIGKISRPEPLRGGWGGWCADLAFLCLGTTHECNIYHASMIVLHRHVIKSKSRKIKEEINEALQSLTTITRNLHAHGTPRSVGIEVVL